MDHATTPLTATSQFIEADNDDDFDEDNIPGFSHPSLASPGIPDKGKGRAPPEQLALPSGNGGQGPMQSPGVSGRIGTPVPNGNGGSGGRGARRTVGGVQVETRYVFPF